MKKKNNKLTLEKKNHINREKYVLIKMQDLN